MAPKTSNDIPVHLRVLVALNFFSNGAYQRCIGNHINHPISPSSVCRILGYFAQAMQGLASFYIRFPSLKARRLSISKR